MELIKFTHACVRLHDGGRSLLLDPGVWTEPEAYEGVEDVLVTHEHFDHVHPETLAAAARRNSALRVWAPDPIASELRDLLGDTVTTVTTGDGFEAAGFSVNVVGGAHAEIYEGLPGCANVGYLVTGSTGGAVYHPGDSLFVPEADVETLLVPVSAPWFKLSEGLDFARAVKPARAYPIHDRMLSEDIGQPGADRWFEMKANTQYARIPVGGSVEL
ncbi:MBL fold metallo-hydrolase [Hamadaea tsunoensis]|uniref:MBL fold metallo-hydrolase n=1 Tax=Hamadaea tsunoensis TaxID=53368 RepID=UPI000484A663|nr:MBL fold metallo-hydrolase [Hamadaea tsunoensis]